LHLHRSYRSYYRYIHCFSRCDANRKKGNARKLPLSKPKERENVMISDARFCKVESVPTNRENHMNDVEIKIPLLIANRSCTESEKKSFRITMLLSLPIVVLHMRKPGKNSVRSNAPATSFCDKYRIRCTGIYPDKSRPNKSPILKTTKLKGT